MTTEGEVIPSTMSVSSGVGAMVLRSVTVFLARGRAASRARAAHQLEREPRAGNRAMSPINKVPSRVLEYLRRKTRFTRSEIAGLYKIYRNLLTASNPELAVTPNIGITKTAPKNEGIDTILFREILFNTFELVTEDVLIDRIFMNWDKNGDGALKFEAFVCGLNIMLKGNLTEKIVYCFDIYDLNSDGFITKDEMFNLMRNCLLKQPGDEDPDEGVKDLVDLILKKFDLDKDGKVSYRDYEKTVRSDHLLLEAFGQCLPHNSQILSFMESVTC